MSSPSRVMSSTVPTITVQAQVTKVSNKKSGQDAIKSTVRKDQEDKIETWERQVKQDNSVQQ